MNPGTNINLGYLDINVKWPFYWAVSKKIRE